MPLSEHEQRLLEQMERALYAEDPKFASSLQRPSLGQASRGRLVAGAATALAGLALLVTGVATKLPIVGVVGFLAMLAGVIVAFTGSRSAEAAENGAVGATGASAPTTSPKPKKAGGFMDRMEYRWRNRREGDQRPQ